MLFGQVLWLCCIEPIFNFPPTVETTTKCFCSMIFFSKMNGNVKESLQFLLLMSIMYQGFEKMESYCVKLIILYTRGELSF